MAHVSELKNILVPGGAGYIGSHVLLALILTGKYKCIVLDNYCNSFPTAITRVHEIALAELGPNATPLQKEAAKVDLRKGDLTNKADVESIFKDYKDKGGLWGVVHVAAHKAVGESGEKPLQYYNNNVSATILLLDVMSQYGCTNLVYSSSATVYGTPPVVPIPETSPLQPESVYGRTKMMSELMIRDLCDASVGGGKEGMGTEWRAIGLRYFNPAGAHPSGRLGEDPRGKPGNLLPLLAQIAIGKHREKPLMVFGQDYPTKDGTCVRDYLHVMDLAQGHVNAVDALADPETSERIFASLLHDGKGKYKVYNLGKGRGQSVMEMIAAMRKATGYEYPIEIAARRRGDVPNLTADASLAQKEIGFTAKRDLDEMCRDLWNWQTKNPNGYTNA